MTDEVANGTIKVCPVCCRGRIALIFREWIFRTGVCRVEFVHTDSSDCIKFYSIKTYNHKEP